MCKTHARVPLAPEKIESVARGPICPPNPPIKERQTALQVNLVAPSCRSKLDALSQAQPAIVLGGAFELLHHERPPGDAIALARLHLHRPRADEGDEVAITELAQPPGDEDVVLLGGEEAAVSGSSMTIFLTRSLNQAVTIPALRRGSRGRVNMV